MKPHQTLLFILAVFAVLSFFMLIFPENGFQITSDLNLKFTSFSKVFGQNEVENADISNIVAGADIEDIYSEELQATKLDSAIVDGKVVYFQVSKISIDSLKQPLDFPNNDRSLLSNFFSSLIEARNNGQNIRVMHYGDSQIEGDRMTSYIRFRMQAQFGGTGVGLTPVRQAYDFGIPMKPESSSNWRRYAIYGNQDQTMEKKQYGVLASFVRFSPRFNDEAAVDTANYTHNVQTISTIDSIRREVQSPTYEAWVTFSKTRSAYESSQQFSTCKMYYSNNKRPVEVKVFSGENLIATDTLFPTEDFKVAKWHFPSQPQEVTLRFSGKDSPDIYGVSFESDNGIFVDNIGMRGNSGTIFTKMDLQQLSQMYQELNVKLLILQFGGNVIPYNSAEGYVNYSGWLYSQFSALKNAIPGVSIIVIGPADMSKKEGSSYVTHHNVEPVRDAVKNAAFSAGCAYWDMYEAMGGKNSMASWVFANPSLAEKDFTHFNPRGARLISSMFYDALMYEYNYYIENVYSGDVAAGTTSRMGK